MIRRNRPKKADPRWSVTKVIFVTALVVAIVCSDDPPAPWVERLLYLLGLS